MSGARGMPPGVQQQAAEMQDVYRRLAALERAAASYRSGGIMDGDLTVTGTVTAEAGLVSEADLAAVNASLSGNLDMNAGDITDVAAVGPITNMGAVPRVTNPAGAATGGTARGIEVFQPNSGEDAVMSFHVSGDFAGHFGIGGDVNDLVVGGWSYGANRYRVWHAGNDVVQGNTRPHFEVRRSTALSVPDLTMTAHGMNITVQDPFNMHAGSNGYVTIPTTGIWMINLFALTDNINVAGARQVVLAKDAGGGGADTTERLASSTHANIGTGAYGSLNANYVGRLTAGTQVWALAYQTTGATRTWGIANRRDLNAFSGAMLYPTG